MPMTLRGSQAINLTCGRAVLSRIVHKYWALASIYEEIIINIGCIYDQSHFEIIMSTIQNSHKDSNY